MQTTLTRAAKAERLALLEEKERRADLARRHIERERVRADAVQIRERCKTLAGFVREAWHVLEPSNIYVHGWVIDAICQHLEAVTAGQITRLLINVPPGTMKSLLVSVIWPAWEWGPMGMPGLRYLTTSYSEDYAKRDARRMRDLVESDWYQELWGDRVKLVRAGEKSFSNTEHGWREAKPFGSLTAGRGDRVLIDDPHSTEKAESEADRNRAIRIFRESLPTRVNDAATSAIVIIMQRLHESDVSGQALSLDLGYCYLCLPMEFEPERKCVTEIGFEDPRTEDGELLFPERFPRHTVDRDKKAMGSYACTPGESPVLMADLSMKPIRDIAVGDSVIGFSAGVVSDEASYSRQRMRHTKVTNVFRYRGPVVKMTLDSGETIRCTPDHKWYRKQRNDGGKVYGPATLGSKLTRVCPPALPALTGEDIRTAGWLAGFYDADGSVSFQRRHGNTTPVSTICFYQGAGRNRPLCDKLEVSLRQLGFDFTYSCDDRKDPERGVNFEYRCYRLRGKSLPLMQRFIHLVQPVKWLDRMIEGALAAKFRVGFERVVRIEPDGIEDVYALETETGNYVVWGLASSNSAGQYQQRPAPRGGAMFKRHWFNPIGAVPAGCRWVRGWDLAATASKTAARTSGTLIGVAPSGRTIIAHNVVIQGGSHEVKQLLRATAAADVQTYGPAVQGSIPQDPGAGGKVWAQDLIAHLAGFNYRYSPESGEKEIRAQPLEAQGEAGNIDMLIGDWNKDFLDEVETFPSGKFKDRVDSASRAYSVLVMEAAPVWYVG